MTPSCMVNFDRGRKSGGGMATSPSTRAVSVGRLPACGERASSVVGDGELAVLAGTRPGSQDEGGCRRRPR